jgi:hypothetical protein
MAISKKDFGFSVHNMLSFLESNNIKMTREALRKRILRLYPEGMGIQYTYAKEQGQPLYCTRATANEVLCNIAQWKLHDPSNLITKINEVF